MQIMNILLGNSGNKISTEICCDYEFQITRKSGNHIRGGYDKYTIHMYLNQQRKIKICDFTICYLLWYSDKDIVRFGTYWPLQQIVWHDEPILHPHHGVNISVSKEAIILFKEKMKTIHFMIGRDLKIMQRFGYHIEEPVYDTLDSIFANIP